MISEFTYTLETLIQAGKRRMRIVDVPIRARHTPRRSRLAATTAHYVTNAGAAMARAYAMYQPLKLFVAIGTSCLAGAVVIGLRFLVVWYLQGSLPRGAFVQSLILAAILAIIGFQMLALGVVSDLLAANRKLMEESLYRLRRSDVAREAVASVADLPGVRTAARRPVSPAAERGR